MQILDISSCYPTMVQSHFHRFFRFQICPKCYHIQEKTRNPSISFVFSSSPNLIKRLQSGGPSPEKNGEKSPLFWYICFLFSRFFPSFAPLAPHVSADIFLTFYREKTKCSLFLRFLQHRFSVKTCFSFFLEPLWFIMCTRVFPEENVFQMFDKLEIVQIIHNSYPTFFLNTHSEIVLYHSLSPLFLFSLNTSCPFYSVLSFLSLIFSP